MKTRFIALTTTLLCFVAGLSHAQQLVKGKISDEKDGSPVSFANVLLLKQDSTYIIGTTSDINGTFTLSNPANENSILSVSYIGYESACLPLNSSRNPQEEIEVQLKQSAIHLSEVTIQARSVIIKNDRKIILPNEEQIKMSTDGTDILRKMQLPRIMVDPTSGEITMSGSGTVQLRVNGVEVTSAEIASIPPADILRIEYHDDPGVRFGGADAVIDYITRRKESGGNANGVLFNSIGGKRTSADDRLALKYNFGKSEISANATYVKRKSDWTREYDEKLIFPDHEVHRVEVGEPTPFNKSILAGNLNYSLMEKDRYFFNAQLRYTYNDFPNGYEDRRSTLYTSESDVPLTISDHTVEKSKSPALDLYYQQNLSNNQLLIFNVVGTYIDTDSRRTYQEKRDNLLETDIMSHINGDKYSIIAEGIYEKKAGQGKITAGMKHLQAYTNNEYAGTTIADVSLRQAESSVYAEYQGRAGKWGYMANVSGIRLYYSQKDTHTEKYTWQSSARLAFEPSNNLYFRYRVNLRNQTPSLAAMNDVEQAIDAWQVRRGNPDLNIFHTLGQSFTAGYHKGAFGVDVLIGYEYEFKPIMESVFLDNGTFVRMYENQKSFQDLSAEATFTIKPWKNHLSLSVTPRIERFFSKGNTYRHTYTMHEVRANLDFTYNNWMANFTTITPPRSMYGEQMMKSDQMYTIMAGYKKSSWSIMAGVLNPFTSEYKTDNRNWSAIIPVTSKIHTSNNRSFLVKFAFNLNYGKQFKGGSKRTNNTDMDSGIMQGGKG
ncbi:TonB-dependent receptor [Bacteroides sp. 51]|uniref:TonB-dependent receptor n=1 Tax=Bacteroides sp. 51 TaxID=2302938 RepID=UPI0013D84D07|nr:carboxypeptidase-like regulatory domain-containing protein [Bacteroides sp. 51]NDV82382.1 hypothetical protein [Bacteroides sp. 51]